ncbi:MAG: DUF3368 domain-containing protein [Victivallales bacterium]
MPDTRELVVNTEPIIAIIAALGDLKILHRLYERVLVPFEVCQEMLAYNSSRYGAAEFEVALDKNIATVCIDEDAGRRVARLNGLRVTGSLGILIRAKREGHNISLSEAIGRMQTRGIYLTQRVIQAALKQAGEVKVQ